MKKVYLAGPIVGLTYEEANGWRTKVKSELVSSNIICYSPMRHCRYHESNKTEALPSHYNHLNPLQTNEVMTTNKSITARDRYDVYSSDLVLVNFLNAKRGALGTCIEIGWADAKQKPIVVILEPNSIHDHGMITEIAGFIVPSVDEAIKLVRSILLP
jgi:nucleoside 2-deoxyribosyltransferase